MMLTIIFGATFNMHKKLWSSQLFVTKQLISCSFVTIDSTEIVCKPKHSSLIVCHLQNKISLLILQKLLLAMLILFGTPVATDSEVLHYKMILINNVSAILEREYEIVYAIKIINNELAAM